MTGVPTPRTKHSWEVQLEFPTSIVTGPGSACRNPGSSPESVTSTLRTFERSIAAGPSEAVGKAAIDGMTSPRAEARAAPPTTMMMLSLFRFRMV
jgi:hypothetical protein